MIWIALFALVGVAFWLAAACAWYRDRRLQAHGLRAHGKVIGVREVADTEGFPQFLRVVRFTAAEGRTIEFTDLVPTRERMRYSVGESVPVVYDPENLHRARIDREGSRGIAFLLLMGTIFVLLSCAGFAVGGQRS